MTTDNKKISAEILSSAGLRKTAPRLAIISTLLKATTPLTQTQIAAKLAKSTPDKATIYRNLKILTKAGLVHKAFISSRIWHFELARNCTEQKCHPHFTCTKCGKTECFITSRPRIPVDIPKGFIIKHQKTELTGLCPRCSKL